MGFPHPPPKKNNKTKAGISAVRGESFLAESWTGLSRINVLVPSGSAPNIEFFPPFKPFKFQGLFLHETVQIHIGHIPGVYVETTEKHFIPVQILYIHLKKHWCGAECLFVLGCSYAYAESLNHGVSSCFLQTLKGKMP